MAIVIPIQYSPIRKLNVHRDLLEIADLIELCFADQMDAEGREYVRQIRRAACDSRYLRWIRIAGERISYPLHGFVWEEDGRIIGNLTLVPYLVQGQWRYLIANVAVHPDYRRRGIARRLTERAVEYARSQGAASAWLQVREDNQPAYRLYHSLAFTLRARRTTWQATERYAPSQPAPDGITVTPRINTDWPDHQEWLKQIYPPEVAWNLSFSLDRFSPSLWRSLLRTLYSEEIYHWAARRDNQLIGIVSLEPMPRSHDLLWIAAPPGEDKAALDALLPYLRKNQPPGRYYSLNYPAGQAEEIFRKYGFSILTTLIWMELPFDNLPQRR